MTNNPLLDLHAALRGARAKGRKTDIDLYERFGQIKGAAGDWLKDLGKNGYEHSERIEQYLTELTKKLIERDLLTQAEIFVLLCAAYMHDIGYWQNGQLQAKGHPERSRKLIEDWPDTYLLGDFPSLGGEQKLGSKLHYTLYVCAPASSRPLLAETPPDSLDLRLAFGSYF